MNLINLRVLFKKGFTAIKRFQFQVNVVSRKNEKTNQVNKKQNPLRRNANIAKQINVGKLLQ